MRREEPGQVEGERPLEQPLQEELLLEEVQAELEQAGTVQRVNPNQHKVSEERKRGNPTHRPIRS